jgi:hypothetical protein
VAIIFADYIYYKVKDGLSDERRIYSPLKLGKRGISG